MKEDAEETRPKIRMKKLKREERGEAKEPGMRQVVPDRLGNCGISARKQHWEKQVSLRKMKARMRKQVDFLDAIVHHDGTKRLEEL